VVDAAVSPPATPLATQRRALLVAVVGAAVPAVIIGAVLAAVVEVWVGLGVLVVLTLVGAVLIWRRSTAFCLRLLGAAPCQPERHARLVNVTEGLCATFGLRVPDLWTIADPVPNACALGRSADDAVLVVTDGLLDTLGLIELEGLVAHELAHLKRGETALAGVAVTVTAPLARITGSDGWLRSVVGRGREYDADQLAVATVRYPPGLRDALTMIGNGPRPAAGSIFEDRRLAMTRWIWVNQDPGHSGSAGTSPASLDDLDVRIAALAES
jgi:Zn-dependent protease with chaperone function